MSRVRRNVHGEVTGLRVQVLHILRNVCAVAACGYGVAVSVAEWEILSAGDLCQWNCQCRVATSSEIDTHDMNGTREVGHRLHDSVLRKQYALCGGLLSVERSLQSSIGEVWEVEEVELVGVRLGTSLR